MLVAAIAAEYNPFHSGHSYHIEKTRAAGATHIVAIMSGNFTQRGSPAVMLKHQRAKAALLGGVDLVVELPLPYAMATAQRFAYGVATIAEALGCVDLLSFGSESGYLTLINAAASAVDSPQVTCLMRELLKKGMTFAKARNLAVAELFGDEVGDILGTPNDLLAVEYIRQLKAIGSTISPFAVERCGPLHDSEKVEGNLASASYLRALMGSGGVEALKNHIPEKCIAPLEEAFQNGSAPFSMQKLETMMLGVLRRISPQELASLPDVSEGLEHRIYAAIRQATSIEEVYAFAKSKRYTAARIRRVVMSAFLGIDGTLSSMPAPYIRVLGFNERGREILSKAKNTAAIPVSDSLAYLKKQSEISASFANAESTATDLYTLGLPQIKPCGYDFIVDSIRI